MVMVSYLVRTGAFVRNFARRLHAREPRELLLETLDELAATTETVKVPQKQATGRHPQSARTVDELATRLVAEHDGVDPKRVTVQYIRHQREHPARFPAPPRDP